MRRGRWKYLKEENHEPLIDLVNDPGEHADLQIAQRVSCMECEDAAEALTKA
ncbi:MAG: hypothetical protein ABI811_06765 [Acidobacteriota bacterium]